MTCPRGLNPRNLKKGHVKVGSRTQGHDSVEDLVTCRGLQHGLA